MSNLSEMENQVKVVKASPSLSSDRLIWNLDWLMKRRTSTTKQNRTQGTIDRLIQKGGTLLLSQNLPRQ